MVMGTDVPKVEFKSLRNQDEYTAVKFPNADCIELLPGSRNNAYAFPLKQNIVCACMLFT